MVRDTGRQPPYPSSQTFMAGRKILRRGFGLQLFPRGLKSALAVSMSLAEPIGSPPVR